LRRWVLVLVTVLVLAPLGVGTFVGYNYCTQDAGENTLSDCLNDTAVNLHRTAWGSSDDRSSNGTSNGKEESKTFYSKALDQSIKYEIYLPPGYDDRSYSTENGPHIAGCKHVLEA